MIGYQVQGFLKWQITLQPVQVEGLVEVTGYIPSSWPLLSLRLHSKFNVMIARLHSYSNGSMK